MPLRALLVALIAFEKVQGRRDRTSCLSFDAISHARIAGVPSVSRKPLAESIAATPADCRAPSQCVFQSELASVQVCLSLSVPREQMRQSLTVKRPDLKRGQFCLQAGRIEQLMVLASAPGGHVGFMDFCKRQ